MRAEEHPRSRFHKHGKPQLGESAFPAPDGSVTIVPRVFRRVLQLKRRAIQRHHPQIPMRVRLRATGPTMRRYNASSTPLPSLARAELASPG
jgi:hypothetical protein